MNQECRSYRVDISITRKMFAELRLFGPFCQREDLEVLKRQIGRLIDGIADAFGNEKPASLAPVEHEHHTVPVQSAGASEENVTTDV